MKYTRLISTLNTILCMCILVGCATTSPSTESLTAHSVTLAATTQTWNGATLPSYPDGQPKVTILHITIPPGVRLPTHYHPVINAGVLTKGELTVYSVEGDILQLTEGDAIVELVNTPHYGVNHGSKPAEIIVFYAGSVDKPITVTLPQDAEY